MFALPAALTHAQAKGLLPALPATANWQVDAGALRDFDSSALAVLLHWQRQAGAAGQTLKIVNAPARLLELAQIYGVQKALPGLQAESTTGSA